MTVTVEKDLEMLFRKENFLQMLYGSVSLLDSMFSKSSSEESCLHNQIHTFIVGSMIKDMEENLKWQSCIEEFQELYHNVNLLQSLLRNSMSDANFCDGIRYAVFNMKRNIEEKLESLFGNKEFLKLYDYINVVDSLFTTSIRESCSGDDRMRNILCSMWRILEKDTGPLLRRDFQKLYESVNLMNTLLKDSSGESYDSELMIQFQDQITNVADDAANLLLFKGQQDIRLKFGVGVSEIKSWFYNYKYSSVFSTDFPKIIQEITCINEELKKVHEGREVIRVTAPVMLENTSCTAGNLALLNPPQRADRRVDKLVGLEKDLEEMLDALTGQSSNLKIFSITGMAGIGKTAFANELYNHPLIIHRFDVRIWVTVSQEYRLRGLLLGLLSYVTNIQDDICEIETEQLREKLYRSLEGKRYLAVLDDVWDKQIMDELKREFPNDMNGSRVLLTSRLIDVAICSSPEVPHCLRFLNLEESLELLCWKSFANGSCPLELLPVGKEIAKKCHGLPLAIIVVGGLLLKMDKIITVWEEVAQNVSSLVIDGPQHCQGIISLSYNHLPDPLKACFLYMALFPEDYEISSSRLMSLWIAEGFVQPKPQKSLEEVADDYLEDLISRSLIFVKRKSSRGTIKTCIIHDILRVFCLRESKKGNFFQIIQKSGEAFLRNAHDLLSPRLAIYSNFCMFTKSCGSLHRTRSFFCFEALRPTDLKGCAGMSFKLLKVLDMIDVQLPMLPSGIIFLINLKYLALTIQESLILSELSKFRSLQVCIINGESSGHLPRNFWNMTELRHFYLKRRVALSHHPHAFDDLMFPAFTVLRKLLSLSTVGPSSCTKERFLCMPNLKKLGVYETEDDCQFLGWYKNLACLTQLETLKYASSNPFASSHVKPQHLPSCDVFPQNLKKLTLIGTAFPWEGMHQLSMLPKLEVLKLKNYAFSGAVWELGESCFNCLKYLMIGSTNLETWEAYGSHFPSLVHLVLRHCRSLKEIPHRMGEFPLLEKIELHCCGDSAATSAIQLEQEQQDLGNDWLKVFISRR